ncbi:MAG: hypothetical protein K0R34_3523 [Herbinix sp.]|jgi:hypothetical protein|nr:hypothetical protein [Herbinix sp.]
MNNKRNRYIMKKGYEISVELLISYPFQLIGKSYYIELCIGEEVEYNQK